MGSWGPLHQTEYNYITAILRGKMGDNVSFKVFLKNSEEQEVRRFVIDKNVSTSYDYLLEKLRVVFPQIQGSSFTVAWTDEDGDLVNVSSDEELIIDVKIDIETPEGRKSCHVSRQASSASAGAEKEKESKKDEASTEEKKEAEPAKKATTPSDDEEEWTVLNDKKEAEQKEAEEQGASLYPKLTENPPAEIPSAPVASHPDPKIQVALQAMMNMGFSNEGGWLSSLLEAKNGDIGKVLDILQPVKK